MHEKRLEKGFSLTFPIEGEAKRHKSNEQKCVSHYFLRSFVCPQGLSMSRHYRGEFHISHDASRLISVFSPRWKERSRVSREIFNDLNFKMQLIQGKFQ